MYKCNLCRSKDLRILIDFGNHPVAKHYQVKTNNAEKNGLLGFIFVPHAA
jgi:hypothetical protein